MNIAKPQANAPPAFERRSRQVIGEETLGWAIVGASSMARNRFVPALRRLPSLPDTGTQYPVMDSNVVGIYSRDEARARLFADDLMLPLVFTNLTDAFRRSDVHCVYVGGHPRHHTELTMAALAADKHVLCETPLATTLEDATAMAHTAASRGLILAVNYYRRAEEAMKRLRQKLMRQDIGDLLGGRMANMVMLDPRLQTWRLRRHDGGVVLNQTIHDIDMARYLLRDEVAAVDARSTQQLLGTQVEEDVVSRIHMRRTGLTLELHDSFLIPHNATRIEMYGSLGTLAVYNAFEDEQTSELCLVQNQRLRPLKLKESDPLQESIARFTQAVRGTDTPLVSSGDGLQNLRVALSILESIRTGHPVDIAPVSRHIDDHSVI